MSTISLISTKPTTLKIIPIYVVVNISPGLGQAQRYGGVKLIFRSICPISPIDMVLSIIMTYVYHCSICPIDIGNPGGPQIVECGSICPSSYANLTTVWYEYEPGRTTMCNVIRPWQQVVYYMQCG
jgi:hypothetical protein